MRQREQSISVFVWNILYSPCLFLTALKAPQWVKCFRASVYSLTASAGTLLCSDQYRMEPFHVQGKNAWPTAHAWPRNAKMKQREKVRCWRNLWPTARSLQVSKYACPEQSSAFGAWQGDGESIFSAVPGLFEQQEARDNASQVLFHPTAEVRGSVTIVLPVIFPSHHY